MSQSTDTGGRYVFDDPEPYEVRKAVEIDTGGGGFVRIESSTGPSPEQSVILSYGSYDQTHYSVVEGNQLIFMSRKEWEAVVREVPILMGWGAK